MNAREMTLSGLVAMVAKHPDLPSEFANEIDRREREEYRAAGSSLLLASFEDAREKIRRLETAAAVAADNHRHERAGLEHQIATLSIEASSTARQVEALSAELETARRDANRYQVEAQTIRNEIGNIARAVLDDAKKRGVCSICAAEGFHEAGCLASIYQEKGNP